MEQLTYVFTDVTGTSGTLRLMWDTVMASVGVHVLSRLDARRADNRPPGSAWFVAGLLDPARGARSLRTASQRDHRRGLASRTDQSRDAGSASAGRRRCSSARRARRMACRRIWSRAACNGRRAGTGRGAGLQRRVHGIEPGCADLARAAAGRPARHPRGRHRTVRSADLQRAGAVGRAGARTVTLEDRLGRRRSARPL